MISPVARRVGILAAFWQQITPIGPFLPVLPVRKYCAVYNLHFDPLHGMEEAVGSIPTRSAKSLNVADAPPVNQNGRKHWLTWMR